MKKITLALLATTVVAGSMSAALADVRTGFYVGTNVSMHANTGKARAKDKSVPYFGKFDLGRTRVGGGAFLGYGWVSNCYYFAGEFAYDYAYNKADVRQPSPTSVIQRVNLSARHVYNFASILGYKLTPSSIAYARLGLNWSERKLRSTISNVPVNRTKSLVSFVPGVGMETTLNRHVKTRLEYTMDFGRKIHRKIGDQSTKACHNYTHSIKAGVAWTF